MWIALLVILVEDGHRLRHDIVPRRHPWSGWSQKQDINIGLSDDKFKSTISDTSCLGIVAPSKWTTPVAKILGLPHDSGHLFLYYECLSPDSMAELELGFNQLLYLSIIAKGRVSLSLKHVCIIIIYLHQVKWLLNDISDTHPQSHLPCPFSYWDTNCYLDWHTQVIPFMADLLRKG